MAGEPKDGGPAFPGQRVETLVFKDVNDPSGRIEVRDIKHSVPYPGMSLRDWLAGQALVGVIASAKGTGPEHVPLVAKVAYEVADAMLAARTQEPK